MKSTASDILLNVKKVWSIKIFRSFLGLLTTLMVLAFLVYYASKSYTELQAILPNAKPWFLLLTFPCFALAIYIGGVLWSKQVMYFGIPYTHRFNMRAYVITLFARRLPGPFLQVIGRVALYKKNGASAKALSFISGLEMALSLWAGVLVTLSSWYFFNRLQNTHGGWLLLFLALLTILLHPRTIRFLFNNLTRSEQISSIAYRAILEWLAGYVVLWMIGGVILFLVIYSIYPLDPALWLMALFAWSASGVSGTLIAFLPSGLGVTEITMSLILGQFMPSSVAVSVALVFRILLTLYDFLFSFTYLGLERLNNTNGLLK